VTPEEIIKNIDGREFSKQREILTRIIDYECYRPDADELEFLEGLRNLLDTVADCAADDYGIQSRYGSDSDC